MALNALMKISNASGETKVVGKYKKEKWLEIQGWDWEVEAETSWTKGGGASVGKPNPGKFTFEHYFDTASCTIMRYIFCGQSFDKIELEMLKGTGAAKGQQVFFRMEMRDAFITKVANNATDEGNVVQKVELVFKEVTFGYKPQMDADSGKPAGSLGSETNVSWDIPAGKVK